MQNTIEWVEKPVKVLAKLKNGHPFDSKKFTLDEGLPLIRIRDLNKSHTAARYNGSRVNAAAVTSNDLLIGMDGDFNVGRWLGEGEAMLNQRMCALSSSDSVIVDYLEYAIAQPLKKINDLTYATTVKHLSTKQVMDLRVKIPKSAKDLGSVVSFLDTETAKIDNLIAKEERLLELLEEKRRATITHAVTRGLDPDVELKETNIPWLGKIPAHWSVVPLFKYVKENKRSNRGMVNENVLTLSYGKIKEKNLDNGGLMPESFETYQIVKPGDIVLRLTDLQNDKTSLRVGHSEFEGIITSAYVDISSTSYESKYLYYLLHAFDLMKVFYNLGAGLRQGMKFSDLKRLPSFDIGREEQLNIVAYLEDYEKKTDELKQKIQTQITLLRERRTSLISHAVTGKIKI